MADTFLSLHPKRTLMSSHHHSLSSPKRPKQPPPPPPSPPIPPNHASLRILCHASHIGAFIGKSGSSIKHLQLDTGSKIRVDDSLTPGSDYRVILIVAPSIPSKRVKLRKRPDDVEEEEEFGEEVSKLQDTALKVFEKVLEVCKESDGGATTTFRVLIDESEAGYVIGKGGKTVEMLKRDSGAKIRVLLRKNLPPHVSPPDEVVEIEGDLLAVKKGLLGVCGRLQQCPQGDKFSNKECKPVESTSQTSIHNFRVDPPLQRAPLYTATTSSSPAIVARPLSFEVQRTALSLATNSSSPTTVTRPSSFEVDWPLSTESKLDQQEVIFKILCPNDRVGGVIGRGGSIVQALQEESGAHICIGPSVTNCDERLVTVTSKEDVDSRYSPAQRAVVLVFSRSAEAAAVKGQDAGSNKGSSVSARLLVPSNQVGCLLGKGGTIVSEMRKATGANIRILKGEQMPKCASRDDQVVEITGQFIKIQDALYQVTSRLRSNIFPSNVTSVSGSQTNTSLALDASKHERVRDLPIGVHHTLANSHSIDGISTMRQGLDSLYNRQRLDHSPLGGSQTSEVALDAIQHARVRELPIGGHHSFATSQSIDGHGRSTMRHDLDSLYNPQRLGHSRLGGSRTSEVAVGGNSRNFVNFGRGLGHANGGAELGSTNRAAIVTNTTVEILVPEDAVSSVYGENGRNLLRIRQISGAKVIMHDPSPETRDSTVLISGTPEETQAAQSLLHAFILTGSS